MSSALDITQAVNPPRAAFLDYPLGHTTGKPHAPELQREILVQALEGFTSLTTPGSVKILPFRWSEDDPWKRTAMLDGDSRVPRDDTPQYQNEEDRQRAEVKDKLKIGSLSLGELFEATDRGDESGNMLAKLKVVSVLESLPGVGKVNAKRLLPTCSLSIGTASATMKKGAAKEMA